MVKLIWVISVSLLLTSTTAAQDSLRERIAKFDCFGVQSHEGTLSVTLHAYTRDQYLANLAELEQDKERIANHKIKVAEYQQQLKDAQEAFRTNRSRDILDELGDLRKKGPPEIELSDFASKIRLHTKVTLGNDYLALVEEVDPDTEIVIPLSQIGRIVFRKSSSEVKNASAIKPGGIGDGQITPAPAQRKSTPHTQVQTRPSGLTFDLADDSLYQPIVPKEDPGGMLIGGVNSSNAIRRLKSINGVTIADLERRMRPGSKAANGSLSGFLGEDEKLLDILVADNEFIRTRGLEHRQLAIPLMQISNRAAELGILRPVEFEHAGTKWRVVVRASRGYQYSPFDDDTKTNADFEVTNLGNGQTLKFSGLVPLMIERYGFYEGKGTPYRVEPSDVIKLLGLPATEAEGSANK